MKMLVYGAGNIGSLYAALLKEAGHDVSILARGKRLFDIRQHGIQIESVESGKQTTTTINVVEWLDAADSYDLVLVILPKHRVSEVLPILAANRQIPSLMFFGNNAAGSEEMVAKLGRDRVLLGFPGAAVTHDHVIRYLITSAREQPTTIGELDGRQSPRIEGIADAFSAAGFPVSICANMDAWLKTHVAKISPTANALYMAGGDIHRLSRTRDAQVLMLRAIHEGYRVLAALGIPITPKSHKIFKWLPEPLLLVLMRHMLKSDTMSIKIGHALGARKEMQILADEFRKLSQQAKVRTPSINILNRYLDTQIEPAPDGRSEIAINWNAVWIALSAVAVCVALLSFQLE